MKRSFKVGLVIVLAAIAAWCGRAAWRAHKNIVTLHVRNTPLAVVLKILERQTWEKIIADSHLDTKITLHVDNMPLLDVLDRIGEQAGGLATTVHAIFKTHPAVDRLQSAIRSGDIAKASGWTNIAPRLSFTPGEHGQSATDEMPSMAQGERGQRRVMMDHNVVVRRGSDGKVVSQNSGPIMRFGRRGGPGGNFEEEVITPERIVMETALQPSFNFDTPPTPDHQSALAAAAPLKGKVTTLYTLRKSFAGSMVANSMRRLRREQNGAKSREGFSIDAAEREARRANLSRYMNLTPEQRAERSRERQEPGAPPPP